MFKAEFEFRIDPVKQLDTLTTGMRTRVIRIGMNKAAATVKAATVSEAPARYGYLKKSMRIKVKNYKNSDKWVAVVGPKSDFKKQKGKRKRGPGTGSPIYHRPAMYAGLVEKGHGGPHPAAPHPFLKPALDSSIATYVSTLQASIKDQIATLLK